MIVIKTFLSRAAWDRNTNFVYLNPNPTSPTLTFSHWNRKKSFFQNYYRRINLIFYWLEIDKIRHCQPNFRHHRIQSCLKIFIHAFSKKWNEVARVLPRVITSEFRIGQFRDEDHRKDAPYFRLRTFENLKSTDEGFCSFDKLINVFGCL